VRINWLESKIASIFFFWSVVVLLSLFAFTLFLAVPGIPQFLNSSSAKSSLVALFVALAAAGIPSMLLVFLGMAIFCAYIDQSSIGAKVIWFVLFFLTGPIGSVVYYFVVYRRVGAARRDTTSIAT
jgi:hypothetical protein